MNIKNIFSLIIFSVCLLVEGIAQTPPENQTDTVVVADKTKVFVLTIRSNIDPRSNRKTDLALTEATNINADLIIIDMNTYGGAVTDANEIRSRILNYEKPVYVFINDNAASAGALISIACDSIYMVPGASIGAATVVTADGQQAPDKYQSYMRSIMRATAEANNRDPRIAEAMVDENIEIEGITARGEVITFATSEAIRHGFCEAEVRSIADLLKHVGITDYEIVHYELSASEKIISFFINPFVSGILILIIIGGLYFELQTPGVGFPILASFTALILYLTPYYLNGLATHFEIILFFVGLGLLAVEIFVIPGFGIAGVGGITLAVGSLILMMVNNDQFDFTFVETAALLEAIASALGGIILGSILLFFSGARLMNTSLFNRVALMSVQDKLEGYSSHFREVSLVGKKGVAYTALRPCGKIMIDGELYEACTRGDYVEKNTEVLVIDDAGGSLRVRKTEAGAHL
jgi:membrane-bound serine protease (ClpP class)